MDYFYDLYADYILTRAIELNENDILSINTEEENVPFARLLAEKAKEKTGNGSYLIVIENKRAKDAVEIFSDYLIEKNPTVFIYLQTKEDEGEFIEEKLYSAREAQLFGHLADPLILPEAEVAFITVPMPNELWAKKISEDGDKNLYALLSDFLSLGQRDSQARLKDDIDVVNYDLNNLNFHKGLKAHLYSDDGMTDLTFSFIPSSEFKSLLFETKDKRRFMPHLFPFSYFRAIDRYSANGHISTNKPFFVFSHLVGSASFEFEDGKVVSYSSDSESAKRIGTYLIQDEDAPRLAEISITETFSEISDIPCFSYKEWDKLHGIVLTLGSSRSEGIPFKSEDEAINAGCANSLFCLSLPLSTDLNLEIEDDLAYSDGIIEDMSDY